MNVRVYAAIFGILFLIFGILGFMPQQLEVNGYYLNLFKINVWHNILYIITGIISLLVSFVSPHACRMFFKIFAVIYLFLAVLAFMIGGDLILLHVNRADNVLHLIIGAIFAYLGYGKPRAEQRVRVDDRHDRRPPEDRTGTGGGQSDTNRVAKNQSERPVHVDLHKTSGKDIEK